MNSLLSKIGVILASGVMLVSSLFGIHSQPSLGSVAPQTPANFETSLAFPIGTTDTSMTLNSGVIFNGNLLAGYTCFTADSATPALEYICGTASGTLVSNLVRGIDPQTGTTSVSSLIFSHRRGADIKITDFPTLAILSRITNGIDGFNQLIHYDTHPNFTGVASTSLTDKAYVDAGLQAGCSNSSETVNGCSELAMSSEAALGTSIGGTGARLVLPSSIATSSSDIAQNSVVVTQANGKIKQNFLDLTQNYIWTGNHSFLGTGAFSSTTSFTATSTFSSGVSFPATAAAPFQINTVPYIFPSSDGTNGQTLTTNGSKTLSWTTQSSKIVSTTTSASYTGTTAEQTLTSLTVPGGTLGTNNILRGTFELSFQNKASSHTQTIRVKYGGTTVGTFLFTSSASTDTFHTLQFRLYANGATNAQNFKGNDAADSGVSQLTILAAGTSAIDSTMSQTLVVTAQNSINADVSGISDGVLEVIK